MVRWYSTVSHRDFHHLHVNANIQKTTYKYEYDPTSERLEQILEKVWCGILTTATAIYL